MISALFGLSQPMRMEQRLRLRGVQLHWARCWPMGMSRFWTGSVPVSRFSAAGSIMSKQVCGFVFKGSKPIV